MREAGLCRISLLAGFLWALPSAPVAAELRVLLAFDAGGHRVHRVTRVESYGQGGGDDGVSRSTPSSAVATGATGTVTLTWLDRDGGVLALERAPDPRVGHVPASGGDPSSGGVGALVEGGWLVRGPDEARTLLLRLPDRERPPLGSEQWRLDLDVNGSAER